MGDPLCVIRTFVDDDLPFAISLRDLAGQFAERNDRTC